MQGTVKWYKEVKGYGFIIDEWTQENYFVHSSGLIDKIKEGDRVSFTLIKTDKGMCATEVALIS